MLRLIAIAAGLVLAARALASRQSARVEPPLTRFSDGPSEEEVEQELRARA